jgi:hypothetical protein
MRHSRQAMSGFCRQHSIVDFRWLEFGAFPGGTHMAANTLSVISCTGPYYIVDSPYVHASASRNSVLDLPCQITITVPLAFGYFVQVGPASTVELQHATIGGAGSGSSTGVRSPCRTGRCSWPAFPCRAIRPSHRADRGRYGERGSRSS